MLIPVVLSDPTHSGPVQLIDAGISIRDKHGGQVEVMDGKLHVVEDDGTLGGLINLPCLRHDEYGKEVTDQEVYDSLPIRVNGQVWARIARTILVHVSQPQPLRSAKAVASPLVQQPRHRYSTWEPGIAKGVWVLWHRRNQPVDVHG